MEIALQRLDGVDEVAISMERQELVVTYTGRGSFDPAALREAVGHAGVNILRFEIQARGRIRARTGEMIFIAGRDRFRLVNSPPMPDDQTLLIKGEVLRETDERTELMELQVREFQAVDPE